MSESVSAVAEESAVALPQAEPAPVLAGALLRQAREAQGLHIAALAVALKVPVRQIEALEGDRLDVLPDLVFVRALAGSVCRQLKIDPKPVLARLPVSQPRERKEREPINEPFRPPSRSHRPAWRTHLTHPPVLVALALLLGAIVLLAMPLLPAGWGVSSGTNAVQGPAGTAPGTAASAAPSAVSPSPVAAGMPGTVIESVTPAVPAVPSTPSAPAAAPVPGAHAPSR